MGRLIGINLTGSFLAIRALAPVMSDGGSIVNISSSAGLVGYFGAAYSASNWARRGLAKAAAIELASRRIRVNAICRGLVDTDMARKPNAVYGEEQAAAFYEKCRQSTPFGRGADPEEVADLRFPKSALQDLPDPKLAHGEHPRVVVGVAQHGGG